MSDICKVCSKDISNIINKNLCTACTNLYSRKKFKEKCLNYKGNKCEHCGCNDEIVLEFHHLNPNKKDINISDLVQYNRNWENAKKELDKCIILCANCHRKEHGKYNIELYKLIVQYREETNKINNEKRKNNIKNSLKLRLTKKTTLKPSKEELEKLIWKQPTTHIAKIYGVSDKAVEKWCKTYNISKPPRGYWTNNPKEI